MSYSISTLLTRNLHDVFGENDPARRRAAIDEIFTKDCVFYEPRGVMGKHEDKELFLKQSKPFLDKVLKRNSVRFATALVAALSSLVAGLAPALAAAPEHHDQVPGFQKGT